MFVQSPSTMNLNASQPHVSSVPTTTITLIPTPTETEIFQTFLNQSIINVS